MNSDDIDQLAASRDINPNGRSRDQCRHEVVLAGCLSVNWAGPAPPGSALRSRAPAPSPCWLAVTPFAGDCLRCPATLLRIYVKTRRIEGQLRSGAKEKAPPSLARRRRLDRWTWGDSRCWRGRRWSSDIPFSEKILAIGTAKNSALAYATRQHGCGGQEQSGSRDLHPSPSRF